LTFLASRCFREAIQVSLRRHFILKSCVNDFQLCISGLNFPLNCRFGIKSLFDDPAQMFYRHLKVSLAKALLIVSQVVNSALALHYGSNENSLPDPDQQNPTSLSTWSLISPLYTGI
jgi:hypothetical protein